MNIENTNNLRNCTSCRERATAHSNNSCNVARREKWGLEEYPLGSVFAPIQEFRNLYCAEEGFDRGTIFRELDLPFLGSK